MSAVPTSIFGSIVRRSEDPRFLRGEGRYVENLPVEGALRAVFVRSMVAHSRLSGVDVEAARAMPGVVAVWTGNDVGALPSQPPSGHIPEVFSRPLLAHDRSRFAGEPVAVVFAETLAQAMDAAETVHVEEEPLRPVVGVDAALEENAPLLFPEHGSNVCDTFEHEWERDPLEGAEVVVRGRFVNQRVAPVPMEPNAFAAVPDATEGGLTLWASTQIPFDVRTDVAEALGLDPESVRAIAPDVGGGFGAKLTVYGEYLVIAAAALRLGRPIRWIEHRSENLIVMTHGRAQVHDVELGAMRDGSIVGMRAHLFADLGAYPIAAFLPTTTGEMLAGCYVIPRISYRGTSVVTNSTPVAPYRGAGRPEATALIERAVDLLAGELRMDPAELRRRNLIAADAFPYTTTVGTTYDAGDYRRALDEALRIAGYDELRGEQRARRERGERLQLGIGLSSYVEITAFSGREFGSVQVHEDGSVTVRTGISPHGQGHETSLAQVASRVLGVPFERVRVVHSDTGVVPQGEGTFGSRSLQLGGSAVWEAANEVLERARRIAAHELGARFDDVGPLGDGRVGLQDDPARSLTWAQLAVIAADPTRLPEGLTTGLHSERRFRQKGSSFPFGAHVAVVEVDTETGEARPLRHVAVDDCGPILNPMLADGQVHGGIAQGLGQALYEEVIYDEGGAQLTGTLATYGMPSAAELPSYETAHTETPTPLNPLGVKGIGESATVGSTPAAQNAVVDAVSHLGVRHVDMPCSPERVWRAIREARSPEVPARPRPTA